MTTIETVFVQDHQQQIVKLEPLSDGEDATSPPPHSAEKIGEIYRLSADLFSFVCSHCGVSFPLYPLFVVHIEKHLRQLQAHPSVSIPKTTSDDEDSKAAASYIVDAVDTKTINCWPDEDDWTDNEELKKEDSNPPTTTGIECTVCHKRMKSKQILKKHMRLHDPERSGDCPICGRHFASQNYIKDHIKHNHKAKDAYRCDRCEERFELLNQLRHHQESHRASSPLVERGYECYQCQQTFDALPACYQHLDDSHWNPKMRKFQCTNCSAWLKSRITLRNHMKLCSVDEKAHFRCQHCAQEFRFKRLLREHRRVAHPPLDAGQRIYKCPICGEEFVDFIKKANHVKNHRLMARLAEQGYHECPDCDKKYKHAFQLRQHIENRCDLIKPMFTCDICQKTLRVTYKGRHMQRHRKDRIFQCAQCGGQFATKWDLTRHAFYHADERKYQCDLCPKNYKCPQQLAIHKETHTGNYRYVCQVCGHGFSWKASLKKHMLSIHKQTLQTDAEADARYSMLAKSNVNEEKS